MESESERCPICHECIDPHELAVIKGCQHRFCNECIQQWGQNHKQTCPLCQVEFHEVILSAYQPNARHVTIVCDAVKQDVTAEDDLMALDHEYFLPQVQLLYGNLDAILRSVRARMMRGNPKIKATRGFSHDERQLGMIETAMDTLSFHLECMLSHQRIQPLAVMTELQKIEEMIAAHRDDPFAQKYVDIHAPYQSPLRISAADAENMSPSDWDDDGFLYAGEPSELTLANFVVTKKAKGPSKSTKQKQAQAPKSPAPKTKYR
eukprot:TRINITY_DN7343_c0_g1_i2.p1 TRINITY_DN7343_c0_g1~~TRINITY_DN7343_c0_g1_i2.p1  ORF type:complete len:263 (+),score=61.73 TRINITY_DN7343_c0_g1_i2:47-835(+)